MSKNPEISIIIVNFNTRDLTISCIKSIQEYLKMSYEIIVVDNASTDDSLQELKKLKGKEITLIKNKHNLGFAAANNQGLQICKGRYALLLNSDTTLIEDCITPCIDYLKNNSNISIISCKLLNADRTIQPTGGYFPEILPVFYWMFGLDDLPFLKNYIKPFHPKQSYYKKDRELDWVTGAFFLIRTDLTSKIGVLDPEYFMYVEELDYCYRAKENGYGVYFLSKPSIVHFGRGSGTNTFAIEQEMKNLVLFYKKHKKGWMVTTLRVLLKAGSLLRGMFYAILNNENGRKTYFRLAQTL